MSNTLAHHPWPVTDDSAATSNNLPRMDAPSENVNTSTSGHHYNQHDEMNVPGDASGATDNGPNAFGATTTQDYSGYTPYSYPDYQYNYYLYQQQPSNVSSHPQVGSGQNTGAYHQPLSSFQNPSSYVGPTGYTGTYYNHGDYQTMSTPTSGYPTTGVINHTNIWNGTNMEAYPSYEYHKYSVPGHSSAQNTHTASEASLSYQQQYDQWTAYYSQSIPNALHTSDLENKQVTNTPIGSLAPSTCASYSYGHNQPPPPGTTSWRQDFTSSKLPSLQSKNAGADYSQIESSVDSREQNFQANPMSPKGPTIQFSLNNQVFQQFQPPSPTVSRLDAPQTSKIQIPTNPKIAPNLSINVLKIDKSTSTPNATTKPAYVSVLTPKPGLQAPQDSTGTQGSIPPSLRRYIEKSFARCKNDSQRAANQTIMKEMITNASSDGTLLTRDWDAEPVFTLPESEDASCKKSPSWRTKSRWEPVTVQSSEKLNAVTPVMEEKSVWNHQNNNVKLAATLQSNKSASLAKMETWTTVKFTPVEQKTISFTSAQRPVKKPRQGDTNTETSDASSDSDKDQNLTRYYSSAVALANSQEEMKRREHRFKRFEKESEHGAANLYARRASAALFAKHEENSNLAVEDIDWDSLTVKGTCQEVEKCYLRLTSAPDPSTVRPEEVLEKALLMVQNCQKNYLYKCDQLKSIRQDLTVQRIRNELTVKVYETHARTALEAGDLAEYNQCQSQLKTLYADGIRGCHLEFSAYNLLCVILHSNNREVLSSMARLSDEAKKDVAVKHALAVRAAVTSANYRMFFRLYKEAPNLNTCLMDLYVEKMRFAAVKCMCKSYRPTLPIAYIAQVLGFCKDIVGGKETNGLVECDYWLTSHGAILIFGANGEKQLDTKVSSCSLFMPEPEDAVAHGDANLAVVDFLTKAPS